MTRSPLRALQLAWLVLLVFILYILVMRTMGNLEHAHALCVPPHCQFGQVTADEARVLRSLGLPLNLYALSDAALGVLFEIAFIVVAAILIWRKPSDRMALFTAFALLLFGGITGSSDPKIPLTVPQPFFALGTALAALGQVMFFGLFYLFPDGRLVRRWLLIPLIAGLILQVLPLPGGPPGPFAFLGALVVIAPFAIVIYVQIYRYRRLSSPAQRQQTKWIVFGTAAGILGFLLSAVRINVPDVQDNVLLQILDDAGLHGFFMLVPLAFGFAILRYRLYDIDVLVNRTLVYGSLTISLVALYVGGVIALQALARLITGQSSDLAIAIATLAVAAIFNPWRHRLQSFIDRRFYRRRYDASRILAAFQATLRDEVDLDHLTDEILVVARETVQPASASLWLLGGSHAP